MENFYQNPIKTQGDFADPFVLRYNGRYYLYCTNPDIRCWSSANLVEWQLEGSVIDPETFGDLVPFAPEVVYSNGYFYMYTSPSGHGHYVLKSDSPTGPFAKISENVGHSIDGSVFIDDDGRWYFYWAGDEGIWGCEMESPASFGTPVLTGAFMNGWTEGPFVLKKNGRYYMTYTGNHYLSRGYRINAAVSDHPLIGYADDPDNPIVVRTDGPIVGLGHSCTVLGPDLRSYYIIYHNLNTDKSRDLNIDRIFWQEASTKVLGPSATPQPFPSMPDTYGYRGELQGTVLAGEAFTAEFNLRACDGGVSEFGIFLGGGRYRLEFHPVINTLSFIYQNHAEDERILTSLPTGYDFCALHCVRVVCEKNDLQVFVDGRSQLQYTGADGFVGGVGYFGAPIETGFTAITNGEEYEGAELLAEWKLFHAHECEDISREAREHHIHDFRVDTSYTKVVFDQTDGCDTVEAHFTFEPVEAGWTGGVLLMASELADGGEDDNSVLGTNFFIGYFVGMGAEQLFLSKHRYDEQLLCAVPQKWETSKKYRLRIAVKGGDIEVYLNGREQPVMRYRDDRPIVHGKMGLRTKGCKLHAESIRVLLDNK